MSANDLDLDLELDNDLDDLLGDGDTQVGIPGTPLVKEPPAAVKTPPRTPRAAPPSQPPAPAAEADAAMGDSVAAMAADIPVQLVASLGRKTLSLKDLLQMQPGQVVELQQPVTTRVDLVANGKLFAKGELVEIDGQMGVRIVQLVR